MKNFAIAAAAALISLSAVAGASAGDLADRPALWANQAVETVGAHGMSATIPAGQDSAVAPKYSRDGYLPGEAAGDLKVIGSVQTGGVAVAPAYSTSGHLPGDAR